MLWPCQHEGRCIFYVTLRCAQVVINVLKKKNNLLQFLMDKQIQSSLFLVVFALAGPNQKKHINVFLEPCIEHFECFNLLGEI
jgi:hypothetical protein